MTELFDLHESIFDTEGKYSFILRLGIDPLFASIVTFAVYMKRYGRNEYLFLTSCSTSSHLRCAFRWDKSLLSWVLLWGYLLYLGFYAIEPNPSAFMTWPICSSLLELVSTTQLPTIKLVSVNCLSSTASSCWIAWYVGEAFTTPPVFQHEHCVWQSRQLKCFEGILHRRSWASVLASRFSATVSTTLTYFVKRLRSPSFTRISMTLLLLLLSQLAPGWNRYSTVDEYQCSNKDH